MTIFADAILSRSLSESPIVLVDVGARGGLKSNWVPARRYLQVLGYEPDEVEYQRLTKSSDTRQRYANIALHDRMGDVRLYVTRDRGLCSIFPPNRELLDAFPQADRFDVIGTAHVATDTLDNQLSGQGISDVDFVKVDTQGSELCILEGASRALRDSVFGVEVEAEFVEIYKGQPVFADVDRSMTARGYLLFDLRPCYWKRAIGQSVGASHGQMIWADALYLRSIPSLQSVLAQLPDASARRRKTLRALVICLLYGYGDYALEVIGAAGDALSADDRVALERTVRQQNSAAGDLPDFPGRRGLASVLHRLWKAVRPAHRDWSISKAHLGNVD